MLSRRFNLGFVRSYVVGIRTVFCVPTSTTHRCRTSKSKEPDRTEALRGNQEVTKTLIVSLVVFTEAEIKIFSHARVILPKNADSSRTNSCGLHLLGFGCVFIVCPPVGAQSSASAPSRSRNPTKRAPPPGFAPTPRETHSHLVSPSWFGGRRTSIPPLVPRQPQCPRSEKGCSSRRIRGWGD